MHGCRVSYTGEYTSGIENGATTHTSMITCIWYIERCQTHRKAYPLQRYTIYVTHLVPTESATSSGDNSDTFSPLATLLVCTCLMALRNAVLGRMLFGHLLNKMAASLLKSTTTSKTLAGDSLSVSTLLSCCSSPTRSFVLQKLSQLSRSSVSWETEMNGSARRRSLCGAMSNKWNRREELSQHGWTKAKQIK